MVFPSQRTDFCRGPRTLSAPASSSRKLPSEPSRLRSANTHRNGTGVGRPRCPALRKRKRGQIPVPRGLLCWFGPGLGPGDAGLVLPAGRPGVCLRAREGLRSSRGGDPLAVWNVLRVLVTRAPCDLGSHGACFPSQPAREHFHGLLLSPRPWVPSPCCFTCLVVSDSARTLRMEDCPGAFVSARVRFSRGCKSF